MLFPILLLCAEAAASTSPDEIVVTASRVPQQESDVAAGATIIDSKQIERLGEPLLSSLLRLTPSAAVAVSGPAGSLTEVRIRGAEANHTLLFIDGIRANDPAAGNTPRFELLNADIASRLEVVRGPQSALWGSEAIGGVVSVNGIDVAEPGVGGGGGGETGAHGFLRANASGAIVAANASLAGAVGWQRAKGIDSFSGEGDRDGYSNFSARLRGSWRPAPDLALGLAAFTLNGRSEYDGIDLVTFVHSDTLDETRNRLSAGRLWLAVGDDSSGLSGTVSTSLLRSSNINRLASEELNRTRGRRWTLDGQLQYRFSTGAAAHAAILALDHDREAFHARDAIYSGATRQDRQRRHEAVTFEWRTELAPLIADVALRHDRFSEFDDATTLRASALVRLGGGFSVAGSYGEGIAQPTFFDLYGFFPGSFVGNPSLRPESSRGFEASVRYRKGRLQASLIAFVQRLHDEIVDVFDPQTSIGSTRNRNSVSRRSGFEAELGWAISNSLRLAANYAFLHASEPGAAGSLRVRETRRPTHSGAILLDGQSRRLSYGASIAYSGARADTDFDVFPSRPVRLGAYWLADARIAYEVAPGLEIFARGSNLLDDRYQEAFGYRTEGRALFAGVRVKR